MQIGITVIGTNLSSFATGSRIRYLDVGLRALLGDNSGTAATIGVVLRLLGIRSKSQEHITEEDSAPWSSWPPERAAEKKAKVNASTTSCASTTTAPAGS